MSQHVAKCPSCQGRITVDRSAEGGRASCPHCGAKFRFNFRPNPGAQAPAAETSPGSPSEGRANGTPPDSPAAESERPGVGVADDTDTYDLAEDAPPAIAPVESAA